MTEETTPKVKPVQTKKADSKPDEVRLVTTLGPDEDFISTGQTRKLKVTRKGVEEFFQIPITTRGLRALSDEMAKKAPKPKTKMRLITKDEATKAGLPRGMPIYYEDRNDPDYIKASDDFWQDRQLAIVGLGVDIEIKDAQGKVITDPAKRGKFLLERFGSSHITQIFEDIVGLDTIAQEQEDFLSGETSA